MKSKSRLLARSSFLANAVAALAVFTCGPAVAQSAPQPPPDFNTVDQNGVELATGRIVVPLTSVSIGNGGPGSLSYQISTDAFSLDGGLGGYIWPGGSSGATVYGVGQSHTFTQSGYTFTAASGDPSTLSYDSGSGVFTFTAGNGEVGRFSSHDTVHGFQINSRVFPNGVTLRYYYAPYTETDSTGATYTSSLLQAVTSSLGYQLRISYTQKNGVDYVSKVVAFNMANENCSPAASSCSLTNVWPTATYDGINGIASDATGQKATYFSPNTTTVTVAYPSGNVRSYTGTWGSFNQRYYFKVTGYSDGKGSWRYSYPDPYSNTTYVFDPDNSGPKVYNFTSSGAPGTWTVGTAGVQTPTKSWSYNSLSQVTQFTLGGASGLKTNYTYDNRGNLTQETVTASDGSGSTITRTAHYPPTCANAKTCNQPDYTIDSASNRTDYTYDPNSGGVASVTLPAPSNGGVRPQVRYTFSPFNAQFNSGSGGTMSGDTVYLPTQVSQCRTTASCSGTADELKTTTSYDAANALTAIMSTTTSGDGALSATTATTYYPTGDVRSVDGPLAGAADTTRFYYDSARRPIGAIGPDPDGAGPLKYRATRTTYSADGQVAATDAGTATGQGDTDMSTFAASQTVSNTYDAQGRLATTGMTAGGVKYSLSQKSYDNAGALQCEAVRMNQATFGSLPASACTQGTAGSFGPDRIVQYAYDASFRVTSVTSQVGTASPSTEQTSYAPLGQTATVTDANGNVTSYAYDGFGRLSKTNYPLTTTGSGASNAGDYEAYTYDANGNTLSLRKRDGSVIGYTYDNLNRLTVKDIPGGTATDVYYGYDLQGRPTYARFGSASGAGLTNGYDALGRLTSAATNQSGTLLTLGYSYDAAGNRTGLTFPDGVTFQNVYDGMNRFSYILLAGSGYQAGLNYNDQGMVSQRALSFSHATTYLQYDGIGRLTSLNNAFNANGGVNDVTATLAYNPASQISTATRNNSSYAFPGYVNVGRTYAANGLNQYTAAGSATFTYDANGNLTGDGASTYGYDVENRLVSRSGGMVLTYDPVGRLWQTTGGSGTTRFLYDGDNLVAEYDGGGNLLRRYLHGPGDDNPMVWFEGSSVTSANKRSLSADERGSIIAVADDSGNPLAKNSYDEYGIPDSAAMGDKGRFRYTGQTWLPDLGLYYYKARMYSPTLGRFMQTDPIGYSDGLNWYNYAHADPVNGIDPTGMLVCPNGNQQANCSTPPPQPEPGSDVTVTGTRWTPLVIIDPQPYVRQYGSPDHLDYSPGDQAPQKPKPATPGRSQGKVATFLDKCYANYQRDAKKGNVSSPFNAGIREARRGTNAGNRAISGFKPGADASSAGGIFLYELAYQFFGSC